MKISVDTDVLVRAVIGDDNQQAEAAAKVLRDASVIAVPLPCLCEFVWVLRKVYNFDKSAISAAIRALMNSANVVMNRPAVEAGLVTLDDGGDFADGLIAYEGNWLGGETFVSFDREAVALLEKYGHSGKLLSCRALV